MTYHRNLLHFGVFLVTFAGGWVGSGQAAPVLQRDGDNYVAWEAEDFWTNVANNTSPWQVITDANASNALVLTPNGTNHTAPGGGVATYQLQFNLEETYRLYFRMSSPDSGSDSMFRPADFGVDPTEPPSPHLSVTGGVYEWYNDGGSPQPRYEVDSGDLGTNLTLSVGSREAGFRVDRFVLSTDAGLSDAELDALLNWDTYNHFTGTVDSDWSTAGNWEFGIAPRATTLAYIGDGKTVQLAATATTGQLQIGHTDTTLPGNGTLSQTASDLTVLERLSVGEMTSGSPGDSLTGSYTAGAGTSLTVGDAATGRADLYVAENTAAGDSSDSTIAQGTLDLSAADTFTAYLNQLVVGRLTAQYSRANGTLQLAQTNTIDATTIMISDLRDFRNRSVSNDKSEVVLGQTNNIKTDLLTVSGQRGQATLGFADGATNGVLNLTGSSGDKADLHIAYTDADSSPQGNGTMDLSGGTFNATLGEVVVGYRYARGSGTGTLTFDAGEVTADSLVLGSACWATSNPGNGTFTGTLNMEGGSFEIDGDVVAGYGRNFVDDGTYSNRSSHGTGVINLSGDSVFTGHSLTLGVGEDHPSVVARGTGTLNLADTADVDITGNVTLGTGTDSSVGTIQLTGGILDVGGSVTGGVGSSTVHVDGGTMTVADSLAVDSLRVGYEARTASVTIGTGGTGDVQIRGGDLFIGRRTISSSTHTVGTLDASAAASFTADVDSLVIGSLTASGASDVTGTLKLAADSTINADIVRLGYLDGGNVRTITGNLELGEQTTLDTEMFIVGDHKGRGNIDFASSGTLNLSSTSGTKTELRIGDNSDSNTSSTAKGTMDLSGGVLVADLGQLVLGDYASDMADANGDGSGSAIGMLTLSDSDLNNVQVDSVLLGNYARRGTGGSGSTKKASGTITVGGGTFTIAGDVAEGVNYGAANGATVESTINLNGGTMTVGGDLSIGTVNFSDGTLAAQSIGAGGAGTFNWSGGTLQVGTFGTAADAFNLIQNGGTLAPGNSPGMTTVYGDYTMNAGTFEVQINGLDQGDQGLVGDSDDEIGYDFVMVHGNASLDGVLEVALLDDFVPELGTYFDVLQTTGTLAIDGLTLNSNWPTSEFGWWDFGTVPAGDGFALRLSAVPEPTSALLALFACVGLLGCIRPRRCSHRG